MSESINEKAFYKLDRNETLKKINSDAGAGLTTAEAQNRLKKYGKNELKEKGQKSIFKILFDQVKEIMVIILIIAAVISFLLHEYIDGSVIIIIVVLNTILGFWQEFKAEKAMSALKKLTVPLVRVKRDGVIKEISAKHLVPGDIIVVESGNIIPADARIIEESNLKAQEATLTGESEPVEKTVDPILSDNLAIGDRKNMLYMGTIVTYGRGTAVVTGTGMQTELGNIATMLQEVDDEETPLQKRLAKLGTKLAILAAGLIVLVSAISLFRGMELKETFMTAISMAVAAIPEGLPAIVTISLALGAQKMFRKKSLIRHLPAVETLGSVTVICSDKTGTLTQNRMTIKNIVLANQHIKTEDLINEKIDPSVSLLLTAGTLCNDAVLKEDSENGNLEAIGDPTEGAFVIAAEQTSLSKKEAEIHLPRINELPFDSERKRMTTIHKIDNINEKYKNILNLIPEMDKTSNIAFTKGSTDGLLEVCKWIMIDNKVEILSDQLKDKVLTNNKEMAENGIRVLGVACKAIKSDLINNKSNYEKDLIFIGMAGMIDPVRPEVKDAVTTCISAGIRPVMITGDHPLTAIAIAKELGIAQNDNFITGKQLTTMSVTELEKSVLDVSVYARVSPEHKMKIIDALQDKGQIVSMTGDGVNDAPALKSADIGVAMGITGTDVSKESSDMVLLDDNFTTIVNAVKVGRTIYDNIKKFIKYILTGNTGEIFVMLFGPLFGLPIPLLPIQILWINLVTDGLPAIALGYEPAEKDTMRRPPYKPEEGIFSRGLGRQIITTGSLIGLICILVGMFFYRQDNTSRIWQTMVFSTLTFCQMAFALSVRSNRKSFFANNPFTNTPLLLAVFLTFGLQLALIYLPFLQNIFRTTALTLNQLLICLGAGLSLIIAVEIEKLILFILNKKRLA